MSLGARASSRRLLGIAGLLLLLPALAFAQAENGRRQAWAVKVEKGPVIDGVLDDVCWESGRPASDFRQHEPNEGQPATERTEVILLHDPDNLYVGVKCYDSDPSGILVSESERDANLVNTDAFWMVFDTFLDHQNGFVFGTNPSGLEFDAQVSKEGEGSGGGGPGRAGSQRTQRGSGRGVNKNWDGNWQVATHTNHEGWMAEFKIPFRTLRFRGGKDQVWGVNFARNIRRKNEEVHWSLVPRQWDLYRLTYAGELHGLEVKPPRNFKVTPYVVGSMRRDYQGNPEGPTNYLGDAGFDAKYSLRPSLTLDATYNTDFAQVEVDEQQINLTRFNLFFPEKRPFFLENAGLFAVGSAQEVELFFSRRIGIDRSGAIVPILGGSRVTGKIDRWNVGFLNMQMAPLGDCSSVDDHCLTPAHNFTVGRVSRHFGQRSQVGAIIVNKSTTSGFESADYNRTFGLDGRLGLGESFLASAYLAKTSTFHEKEGPDAYDGSDHAYNLRGEYATRSRRVWFEFTEVGKHFNPEVGFLRRKAYRNVETGVFTYIRPESVKWLRELRPHVTYTVFYSLDGFKESESIHMDSHVEWQNGSRFSPAVNVTLEGFREPFEIFPGIFIPAGSYRNAEIAWRFNSDLSAPFSVDAGIDAGGLYSGNIRTYSLGLNWRAGSQLLTGLRYTHNDAKFPIEGPNREFGGRFNTNLIAARINYSFTPRIFLQSLIQYNDAADNWSTNLRFGWLNAAGTGLYLVYREARDLERIDFGDERRVFGGSPLNRALYVKFTREFSVF